MMPLFTGDRIGLTVYCSMPVAIRVAGRLTPLGQTKPVDFGGQVFTPAIQDGSENFQVFNFLQEGQLNSVVVSTDTAAVNRGRCFVIAQIIGQNDATDPAAILFAGYLTSKTMLSGPDGIIESPTQGRGYLFSLAMTTFAVSSCKVTAPANRLWRIIGVTATLQNNNAGGERQLSLQRVLSGGAQQWFMAGITLAPNRAYLVSASSGSAQREAVYAATPGGGFVNFWISPDIFMMPGDMIQISSANGTAGDTVANAFAFIEEWILEV